MKTEAIETAAVGITAAGAKSAASTVAAGLGTAAVSIFDGSNWATFLGVAIAILTFWMTWYFKNKADKREAEAEKREAADSELRRQFYRLHIGQAHEGKPPAVVETDLGVLS